MEWNGVIYTDNRNGMQYRTRRSIKTTVVLVNFVGDWINIKSPDDAELKSRHLIVIKKNTENITLINFNM